MNTHKSGENMDSKLPAPLKFKPYLWYTCIAGFVLFVLWQLLTVEHTSRLRISADSIEIAAITNGVFDEYIPVFGQVVSDETTVLDAIEGGQVTAIHVTNGDYVQAGELIIEFSNPSLLIDITRNEAQVENLRNEYRANTLRFEQSRLENKARLNDLDLDISKLATRLEQLKPLLEKRFIAQQTYDTLIQDYEHKKASRDIIETKIRVEEELYKQQHESALKTTQRLEKNLVQSRKNIENLKVKAPVTGQLSGFDFSLGQSVPSGKRIGEISNQIYIIKSQVDQFYMDKIKEGQYGHIRVNNNEQHKLIVKKIYPTISDGKVSIDFSFLEKQPLLIKQGQTLRIKFTLGESRYTSLIPRGPFINTTGGHWVFVINGETATRRKVKLGLHNEKYIEVIEGLQPGENIIISSYEKFEKIEKIIISQGKINDSITQRF